MKLIHLSDLHIGKRVNEFSMLEDQEFILTQIIHIIDAEAPDGVMIAGDIYDKSIPSEEAVQLFDSFLVRLAKRHIPVFVISGNHDSPQRICFGSKLMESSGIHMAPVYDGTVLPYSLTDEYGTVDIFMLPFLKPVHVRRAFPDEKIESYTDALSVAIGRMARNPENRSILITHQFVTGATRSESEELSVGGSDNVDVSVFEGLDYVALGHIHGPQTIGRDTIRYCGTPLKYSFSEAAHKKSVTIVELRQKGDTAIRTVPLIPKHDLRQLRGTYMELTARSNYEGTPVEDYLHITLTDEEDIPNAIGKLRVIYPNLMKLDYDNTRTRSVGTLTEAADLQAKSPLELFNEFYEKQNGQPMSMEQQDFCSRLMESIWEDAL